MLSIKAASVFFDLIAAGGFSYLSVQIEKHPDSGGADRVADSNETSTWINGIFTI